MTLRALIVAAEAAGVVFDLRGEELRTRKSKGAEIPEELRAEVLERSEEIRLALLARCPGCGDPEPSGRPVVLCSCGYVRPGTPPPEAFCEVDEDAQGETLQPVQQLMIEHRDTARRAAGDTGGAR